MLEYYLFYYAYALTLDDDDCNGRGMRRVRSNQFNGYSGKSCQND